MLFLSLSLLQVSLDYNVQSGKCFKLPVPSDGVALGRMGKVTLEIGSSLGEVRVKVMLGRLT